jgi:Subtilase family
MAIIRGETPQPGAAPQGSRTVVVKLARPVGGAAALAATPAPQRLLQLQPGLAVRPYFSEPGAAAGPGAAALAAPAGQHEFSDFVAVDVTSHEAGDELARSLRQREGVETAYVEAGPTPPPGSPVGANPLAASQGYLNAAPDGIDARWAWANAAGAPVGFVDLEQGWTLNHQDLAGAGITIISGRNQAYFGHGTAVLGEVAAVDNDLGVIGIAFGGRTRVVSQFRPNGSYNTAAAIVAAAGAMARGDVLLLEAQVQYPPAGGPFHPVEVEDATFAAIRNAVDRGIVVVEAGGNGSVDLDNFVDSHGRQRLNRASADFRDSGAILVGAATSAAPHSRLWFSNFGSRIDCYAWGENIATCGDGWTGNAPDSYMSGFGGTSGATPIVTGAALLVQAWAAGRGARQVPGDLRRLLSDPSVNTVSASPADRIGVMPNLRAIVERGLVGHPPPVAAPAAVA